MRLLRAFAALGALVFATASFAAGGGGGGGGSGGGGFGGGSSPQEIAMGHFEAAERARKQALEWFVEAQATTDAKARAQAIESANAKLKRAQRSYKEATRADRRAYYAWNGLGFCQRLLGDNEAALASYERALKIEPGFPQAVEYRGEAYLNLGKLDEAKAAYMDLFGRERALADMLLKKMQAWVAAAKQNPQSPGAQARLDEFAKWVDERAALAQDTASLAAPGAGAEIASW
jgi:tetratricopeptide (TPR) repeat protein